MRRNFAIRPLTIALMVVSLLLFTASVLLGTYTVTPADFLRIVQAQLSGGDPIPGASFIVLENKLPRAVLASLAGLAFGLAGALFQRLLRNPLASPDVIGISAGASASAVFAIVVLGLGGSAVSFVALLGGLGIAAIIHLISRRAARLQGTADAAGTSLILAGIGIGAALQALTHFLMSRTDISTASEALLWITGSLNPADWNRISILGVALIILVPLTFMLARPLRMLELGDDAAAALGVHVTGARLGILMTGVALAAFATAATGPLAFVAFLALPLARNFDARAGLGAAAFSGAALVLAADFTGSALIPLLADGVVLPAGLITGAVGAPFLLWLLAAPHRAEQKSSLRKVA